MLYQSSFFGNSEVFGTSLESTNLLNETEFRRRTSGFLTSTCFLSCSISSELQSGYDGSFDSIPCLLLLVGGDTITICSGFRESSSVPPPFDQHCVEVAALLLGVIIDEFILVGLPQQLCFNFDDDQL